MREMALGVDAEYSSRMHDLVSYGEVFADIYDDLYGGVSTEGIDLLVELSGSGRRALELGIGTGRIALPLAGRGVEVHGVDASPAMVARLRQKPNGERIPVAIGDFAELGSIQGPPST